MCLTEIKGMQCDSFTVPLPLQLMFSSAGRGVPLFFLLTHWDYLFFFLIYIFSRLLSQRLKTKSKNCFEFRLSMCCNSTLVQLSFNKKTLADLLLSPFFFHFHFIDT